MFCEDREKASQAKELKNPIERYVTIVGWIQAQNPYKDISITIYRAKTFCDRKDSSGNVIGKKRSAYAIRRRVELCSNGSYRIVGLAREKYSVNYFVQIKLDGQLQKPRSIVVAGFAPRYRWKLRNHDLVL